MATRSGALIITVALLLISASISHANGTLSGTITDGNNNPLQNMSLTIQGGGIDAYPRYYTASNQLGQFTISVKPGIYYMCIWSYDTSNWFARYYYENITDMNTTQTPISVSEGQTVTVNPKLTTVGGKVTGKVLDSTNKPIVGATVYVYAATDNSRYGYTTDSNGVFTTRAYAPGTNFQAYTYDTGGRSFYYDGNGGTNDSSKKANFVVTSGQTTTSIDFKLPKAITTTKAVVIPLGN